ncbi:MAG: peptidylprolyl isomerase, partial [Nitrospirota bacterium]|nr:peptidylprolyl isomerase [Nitrospirota bacterium]
VANANFLDGQYTAFGEVVSGMEIVDRIVNVQRDGNDNPLQRIEMKMRVTEANA